MDPFELNILGVTDLIETSTNKVLEPGGGEEGISSDKIDLLELDMSDEELLKLKRGYESKSATYTAKIEPRQKANKAYLYGMQKNAQNGKTVASNLLFQATATFVPQALAKNPEPVVYSDNEDEGKAASNDLKTMLQFHADKLGLRKKLGTLVWHWSVYFTSILKYGWSTKLNDITLEVRKPSNFVLDPDGFINDDGDYEGSYLGERIQCTAQELIDLYPKSEEYVSKDVGSQLGTLVTRTEWWNNDYSFSTYKEQVLDKHKNEFFNYEKGKPNHFAVPKMPYTFLSVFSLQEQPHDFTNLVEQNIQNQDDINETETQIMVNLRRGNNSIVASTEGFTAETGKQAMEAMEKGDWILVNGDPQKNLQRVPANPLPQGLMEKLEVSKQTLQGVYGTQGVTAQAANEDTTARGMILNQSFDNTRIGGGVGDSLEIVAKAAFNYFTQLYYVFYDEPHYAAIMGQASAVEYVQLMMTDEQRRFVVSVSPGSMQPKDELTEMNQALDLYKSQALDPLTLFTRLNFPDPMKTAKQTALWTTNPQLYIQQMFPELAQAQPQDSANPQNPTDVTGQPQMPQEPNISQEPANADLSNVKLPQ